MTDARRGSLAVLGAALLWSTGGLFIKAVSLDAWGVSFWRSTFAAVTLFLVYRGISKGSSGRWLSPIVLAGAVDYAVLLVLFVIATKLTTSANAIFLQYTAPIYVVFVEPLMSRQRVQRSDVGAVAVSVFAMALFFVGRLDAHRLWGNLAALASGLAFAAYTLFLKHERVTDAVRWQCVIVGHAIIALFCGLLWMLGWTRLGMTGTEFLELMYLGIVQIGLAYALFTWGIRYIRALDATLISMAEPVLNPVWVYLGIGESPGPWAVAGGAIILSVSLWRSLRSNR